MPSRAKLVWSQHQHCSWRLHLVLASIICPGMISLLHLSVHNNVRLPAHNRRRGLQGQSPCLSLLTAPGPEGGSALCHPSLQDGGSVAVILQANMIRSIAALTLGLAALAIADLPPTVIACSSQHTSVSSLPTSS